MTENFKINFTRLLYVYICAKLQNFTQFCGSHCIIAQVKTSQIGRILQVTHHKAARSSLDWLVV